MVALEQALAELQAGNACGAIQHLRTFILKVRAQAGKKIASADADALIAGAEAVIEMLEEECDGPGLQARAGRFGRFGRGRFAGTEEICPPFGYHGDRNHRNSGKSSSHYGP